MNKNIPVDPVRVYAEGLRTTGADEGTNGVGGARPAKLCHDSAGKVDGSAGSPNKRG